MTRLTCEQAQQAAPELVLGLLDGPDRADVLEHVGGCPACRAAVDDLARVADGLLLLTPEDEPPGGFEARVLARLVPSRSRRPPWLVAAAAVVALVVGVAIGLALGRDGGDQPVAARDATFVTADGEVAGTAQVYDGPPPYMVCELEGGRADGGYTMEVVTDDGRTLPAGYFEADDGDATYAAVLGVPVEDVDSIVIRDPTGTVRLTAEVQ